MGISSDYSALARTNFQGLVSGLETDTLVEALMLNAQSKIDKANQKYTLYEYKQDAYRDVISTIDNFNSSYSSYTSTNSLISNSFFDQMTSTTTSSNFTVTGTSSASDGDISMAVKQLATTSTLSGGSVSSVSNISGSINFDDLVASYECTVAFDVTDDSGVTTQIYLDADDIANILDGVEVEKGAITFSFADGNIKSVLQDGYSSATVIEDGSSTYGLDTLGLSIGDSSGLCVVTSDGLETFTGFRTESDAEAVPYLEITLDGVTKKITVNDIIGSDESETLQNLTDMLDGLFGSGNIIVTDNGADGFSISTFAGREITLSGSDEVVGALGLETGDTNVIYTGATVSDLFGSSFEDGSAEILINGTNITISETDTISEMLSKVNNSASGVVMSFDSFSNTFTIASENSGGGFDIDFGDDNDLLKSILGITSDCTLNEIVSGTVTDSGASYSAGQNAIFTLNGVESQRNTNTFTVSGITFELTGVHEDYGVDGFTGDTVTTSRDIDAVMDGITAFIDDYNAMIEELNGVIDEKYDSEYPPLTDAQREEMSDSEIANWEETAKTGVLANDDLISDYLTAMRTAMYTSYGENGTSLWQIGIEASDEWTENGKLYIDEDKLRQTLMEDPDIVRDLFAGTDGLISGVSSVCKTYANTSSASPGLLVEKAGVAGTATEYNNTLYNWMQTTLSQLEKLETNYTLQYDRYWAAFTNMETVLSSLSSQSAWLSQQFAY